MNIGPSFPNRDKKRPSPRDNAGSSDKKDLIANIRKITGF